MAIAIALLALPACGGSGSSSISNASIMTLNVYAPLSRELYFSDETIEFRADVTDEFNEVVEAEIQWSSNLEGVLISGNRFFTALSSGLHSIATDAFVAATNGRVSLASVVNIAVVSEREANEALIVGTGPLGSDSNCPQPDVWSAFPRGSSITVNVHRAISNPKLDVIRANVDVVGEVTNGQITAELRVLDSVVGPFAENVINIIEDDPQSRGCTSQFACTQWQFNGDGSIRSSFVVVRADQVPVVFAHELGHATYGLCHIDGNKIFARNSMMSAPTEQFFAASASVPSKLDRNTIARFYASSVDPGADRNAILAAGLID